MKFQSGSDMIEDTCPHILRRVKHLILTQTNQSSDTATKAVMAPIVQPTTSVLAAMSSNDALSSSPHLCKFSFTVQAFKDI